MAQYYDDDYDDYGDEEYDERAYAKDVLSQLGKGVKVSEAAIVRKLEETDYNVAKTVKFFKKQAATAANKTKTGGAVVGGGKTQGVIAAKPVAGTAGALLTAAATASISSSPVPILMAKASTAEPPISEALSSASVSVSATAPSVNAASFRSMAELISDDEGEDSSSAAAAGSKVSVTMVVVGHVDSGKSTLSGNLLYQMGHVSQKIMHKYEKESAAIGKGSFSYAWVMDETATERTRGVTVDIAERQFETERCRFTLLDAPGHQDFVPNMIKGAAQANIAVLVVPATAGEFETCRGDSAQTKEHLLLLKAMGVDHVVVAVNKMDSPKVAEAGPWDRTRFMEIQADVRALLRELMFDDTCVRVVPVSGLSGSNLIRPLASGGRGGATATATGAASAGDWSWYTNGSVEDLGGALPGLSLTAALDDLSAGAEARSIVSQRARGLQRAPFRAVVLNELTRTAKSSDAIAQIVQGKLRKGASVGWHVGLSRVVDGSAQAVVCAAKVTHIFRRPMAATGAGVEAQKGWASSTSANEEVSEATVGDRVIVQVVYKNFPGGGGSTSAIGEDQALKEHSVLYKPPSSMHDVKKFYASITTSTDLYPFILPGSMFEMYTYGGMKMVIVKAIHSLHRPVGETGFVAAPPSVFRSAERPEKSKTKIKCIPGNCQAVVKIELLPVEGRNESGMVIEPFGGAGSRGSVLTRFVLRTKGKTCAVGVCEDLLL